jgi:hypothetical protein
VESTILLLLAWSLSLLVSSTVASPHVYAQASAGDEAFDPTDEDLKGEGLIGPPNFGQSAGSTGGDIETIPGSASGFNGSGSIPGPSSSWAPNSVPAWQHPAAQKFQEPLSNSRSSWNPIQSSSLSSSAPPAVYHQGSNDEAWNLWLKMAEQQKQPSAPAPEYGAAAQIAGFGQRPNTLHNQHMAPGQHTSSTQVPPHDHNAITNGAQWSQSNINSGWSSPNGAQMPLGGNADYVPVPPPQQVAGQWTPPAGGWSQPNGFPQATQPVPTPAGQPTFNLSTSATQPGTPTPAQADFVGGFMNWLGQMPNPFNQGQSAPQGFNGAPQGAYPQGNNAPPALSSIFQQGMPNLVDLQKAASSFSIPDMTPTDPNNPLSSPMASYVAGAIGSWVTQQMKSSPPFQLGSAFPPSMPAASSLPSLFPTDLKLEAKGESAANPESQNILDSELADSLLSSNSFPAGDSNSRSQSYSSRPTSFRGPLGIPVPGMLGNALASQRNKFAVNYLLNRSLRGSGFGIRLR